MKKFLERVKLMLAYVLIVAAVCAVIAIAFFASTFRWGPGL